MTARPTTRGAAPTQIAALLLVALALRPQIAAIGPLVPGIRDELGASHFFLGLLTAIPVLCMGLFAGRRCILLSRRAARRWRR